MKRECIAERRIWTAKKRYILSVWDSEGVRYEKPKLKIKGIDGQEFQLVLDINEFSKNAIVSIGSRQYGPRFYVIKDPVPWNAGYLYTFTLVTDNPMIDFVSSQFLQVGLELELVDAAIGEFDQDLLGLPRLGEKIFG